MLMATTPNYALPTPELTDPANVPGDMRKLALVIDGLRVVRFVSYGAKTTDVNGVYTQPHGLGAGYSAVVAWMAMCSAGATGNMAVVAPLFRTVDATNVYFRVFKFDGTPYVGSITLSIIGA
jgi:hypothetical protein